MTNIDDYILGPLNQRNSAELLINRRGCNQFNNFSEQ